MKRPCVFLAAFLATSAAGVVCAQPAPTLVPPPPPPTASVPPPWGSVAPGTLPPPPAPTVGLAYGTGGPAVVGYTTEARYLRDRPSRIVLSSLGGLGVGIGGGLVGALLGLAIDAAGASRGSFLPIGTILGAFSGWFFGVPLGVVLVGNARGGNGGYGWSLLGTLGGFAAAVALSAAVSGSGSSGATSVGAGIFTLLLPVGGAVLGYELSCGPETVPVQRLGRARTTWAPTLYASENGATLGVVGAF